MYRVNHIEYAYIMMCDKVLIKEVNKKKERKLYKRTRHNIIHEYCGVRIRAHYAKIIYDIYDTILFTNIKTCDFNQLDLSS